MLCPNCRQEISDKSIFCRFCGTNLLQTVGSGRIKKISSSSAKTSFGGGIINKFNGLMAAVKEISGFWGIRQILKGIKRHRMAIIAAIIIIILSVTGFAVATVVSRQHKVEKFDRRLTKIQAQSIDLAKSVKAEKENVSSVKQVVHQAKQNSDDLLSSLITYSINVGIHNRKYQDLEKRHRRFANRRLVNRLNTLLSQMHNQTIKYNNQLNAFRDLDGASFPLMAELDSLTQEMNDSERELANKVDVYKKSIKKLSVKRKTISIYSLRFNKDFKSLTKKIKSIDSRHINDDINRLNGKISSVNSKLGEVHQNINERNALKSLLDEDNPSDILDTLVEIWP